MESVFSKLRISQFSGFTLVELLVVIAIISILSVVGVTIFTGAKNAANDAKRKADLDAITKAYEVNFDPLTGFYRALIASDFAGGFPKQPDGTDYNYSIPPGQTATSYQICTPLGSYTGVCTQTNNNCYCKANTQGEPYVVPTPTPTPVPTSTPTPTPDPLYQGLVAYWNMNEGAGDPNVADPVGGNNGTATGTTVVSSIAGLGNARSFNGTSDYISVLDSNSLDLTGSFTVSAWVFPASGIPNEAEIIQKDNATDCRNYGLVVNASKLVSLSSASGPPASCSFANAAATALTLNTWQYITVTHTPTTINFYINGVTVNSVSWGGLGAINTGPLLIGGGPAQPATDFFKGNMDELGFWNRALTDPEITRLCNDFDSNGSCNGLSLY